MGVELHRKENQPLTSQQPAKHALQASLRHPLKPRGKRSATHQGGKPPVPPGPNHTVLRELSRLPDLSIAELKAQYQSLFGKSPPFHTQAYLIKRVAYRLQEIAHGCVSDAAHLKMTVLLQKHGMAQDGFAPKRGGHMGAGGGSAGSGGGRAGCSGKGKNGSTGATRPARGGIQGLHPGTVLRREWDGETHEVRVESHGFVWQGQRYASLSKVARMITGTNWNGPRFFGLRAKTNAPTSEGGDER